jgi:polyisoprenoid-binding protein YceI
VKKLAVLVCLVLASAARQAAAADWNMERSGSRLEFVATFERTAAPGIFREFDARVRFDPDKLTESRIDVTVAVTSADMSSADVNNAIRGPEWFDFQRFPQAEFHATDIRRTDANRYLARGALSLKGVRQPIEVPFLWTGNTDDATMEGEVTVKRVAFGIGVGEWAATNVIGADVKVKFRIRLRKGV